MKIYLVGYWLDYGPGYNDTAFVVDLVTTDEESATERAKKYSHEICIADDGDEFMDWEQCGKVKSTDKQN